MMAKYIIRISRRDIYIVDQRVGIGVMKTRAITSEDKALMKTKQASEVGFYCCSRVYINEVPQKSAIIIGCQPLHHVMLRTI